MALFLLLEYRWPRFRSLLWLILNYWNADSLPGSLQLHVARSSRNADRRPGSTVAPLVLLEYWSSIWLTLAILVPVKWGSKSPLNELSPWPSDRMFRTFLELLFCYHFCNWIWMQESLKDSLIANRFLKDTYLDLCALFCVFVSPKLKLITTRNTSGWNNSMAIVFFLRFTYLDDLFVLFPELKLNASVSFWLFRLSANFR